MKTVIPDPPPPPCLEDSLIHVLNLLRCAKTTAYESADGLNGEQRDLAFSTHHLVDMAYSILIGAVERMEPR